MACAIVDLPLLFGPTNKLIPFDNLIAFWPSKLLKSVISTFDIHIVTAFLPPTLLFIHQRNLVYTVDNHPLDEIEVPQIMAAISGSVGLSGLG
jgi:hypothetical protein